MNKKYHSKPKSTSDFLSGQKYFQSYNNFDDDNYSQNVKKKFIYY